MTRPVLLLLLAASVAAGVWLFAPAEPKQPAVGSCGGSGMCDAGGAVAVHDSVSGVPVAQTAPGPSAGEAGAPPSAGAATAPSAGAAAPATADGPTLRALADRLIAEGEVLDGIQVLRQVTQVDPSARNHGDLGAILERMTALDEALVHLRRAADLDPGNADRWIALANAYYRKVDPGAAWKAERRARQAEPGLVLGRDANGLRMRKDDSAADKK